MTRAGEQLPLVTADEHYGSPESTCVRYECDFALDKPLTDVLIVGKAVAPDRSRVQSLAVRLDVEGRSKQLLVHGDRQWVDAGGSLVPSDALPFTEMPLTFDRAWGGIDDSRGAEACAVETRNPVGVGFAPFRRASDLVGLPVPNIQALGAPVGSPREHHDPAGFGCIGRSWQPRLSHAGTYDAGWRETRAPFLPGDFDRRYFQCAPEDQQFPRFSGGERLSCVHMAESAIVGFKLPKLEIPVTFRFADKDERRSAALDTVILEPHLRRALLVWRASAPMRKKLTLLREVVVGKRPAAIGGGPARTSEGKPHFAGLGPTVEYLIQRRKRSS